MGHENQAERLLPSSSGGSAGQSHNFLAAALLVSLTLHTYREPQRFENTQSEL